MRLVVWGMAALLLSSWLSSAFAQAVNPNDLLAPYQNASPPEDLATRVMTGLLGPSYLAPLTAGISTNTLFGAIFLVFNVIVFAVATVWASYGVIAGIVQTAHEGVALGRRMSAVWMPIRMVTGIGGLVPVFGGFSLSQVAMILATSWGISFANFAYNSAISMASTSATLVSPAFSRTNPSKDGYAMAQALFAQRLCERSYQEKAQDFASRGMSIAPVDVVKEFAFSDIYNGGTTVGRAVGTEDNKAGCYAVGLKRKTYFGMIDQEGRWGSSMTGFRSGAVDYKAINDQAWAGYAANFPTFTSKVRAIADTYYNAKKQDPATQLRVPNDELRIEGVSFVSAVAQEGYVLQQSQIKAAALENMTKYGFFGAGSYYSTLSEVNAAVIQAGDATEFLITSANSVPKMASGDYDSIYAAASKVTGGSGMGTSEAGIDACRFIVQYNENSTGNCSVGQKFVELLLQAGTAGSGGSSVMVDPIIALKNIGDYMMTTGEVILVASLYAADPKESAASGAVGVIGDVVTGGPVKAIAKKMAKELVSSLGGMAPYIGGLLFSVGALCAIYIPMVPFINWVSGLVQYACVVVESFAAAPLWALAHIQADGEGMGQRTERGYLYLLNLLFRPILMVAAFFAASALVILLGSVVLQMFIPAMAAAQGNSITGLFSAIGYVFLFFIIMNIVIQGLFHLVMELADDAIGWVGGIGRNNIGRDTEGKVHNMFMMGGRFGAGGVDKAMATAGAKNAMKGGTKGAGTGTGGIKPNARQQ